MCVHCSKDDDVEWDSDSDGGGDDHDDNVLFYHYHFLDTPPKVADKLYWMEKQKKNQVLLQTFTFCFVRLTFSDRQLLNLLFVDIYIIVYRS